MAVQTSKYGRPTPNRRHRVRIVEFEPTKGFHGGLSPMKMPTGYLPYCQNFVNTIDGRAKLRFGTVSASTNSFVNPSIGAEEVEDVWGNFAAIVPSATTIYYSHKSASLWSGLSYVKSVDAAAATFADQNLSGTSAQYFVATEIFEPSSKSNIVVLSNNSDWMKFCYIDQNTITISDFSWTSTFGGTKTAKSIEAIDDRLIFFNVSTNTGIRYPNRLVWSVRGDPLDYTVANGAGSVDLKDMHGSGQAVRRFNELLILFSDQEIWRGIPTRDAYAFRFERVTEHFGCYYPRTIVATPKGVIFLGKDYEVYLTDGSQIIPLGPAQGTGPSRIQQKLANEIDETNLHRMFAVWNMTENRYELYYPSTSGNATDGFCDRALWYSFEENTWWPQILNVSISDAFEREEYTNALTWDEITDTWDSLYPSWDYYTSSAGNRSINFVDNAGMLYRFASTATSDVSKVWSNGSSADIAKNIDARMRSPAITHGTDGKVVLDEIYLDVYQANPRVNDRVPLVTPSYLTALDQYGSVTTFDGFSNPITGREPAITYDDMIGIYGTNTYGRDFTSIVSVSVMTYGGHLRQSMYYRAGRFPQVEIRSDDGFCPDIYSFQVRVRTAGKF